MKRIDDHTYTLTLTVRNSPGVLVRCAQVFSRRGHNIESLHVAPVPNSFVTSHMTVSAYGKAASLRQITHQLEKIVDVIHVDQKEM